MYQLILKYRKAFYDYIYKSEQKAINTSMFDDIMYNSILSTIRKDEIKGKFEWNNTIKRKINIWFSLYNMFNQNTNTEIMASKVTDLIAKMRSIAKGDANLETPEEFAFGAGQIVSYLIDRSAASNKTYALLEPYLQKSKSGQLQDAIAQTISVYKHDIRVYKGKFERLASHVLTYESDVDMKPLLKYFLAGCFSPCVIYESEKEN
jgi:CRISPR-associated protein Csh1